MTTPQMQAIRDTYRVPATQGGRVRLDYGDYGEGTITGADDMRLRVHFDTGARGICHPTYLTQEET